MSETKFEMLGRDDEEIRGMSEEIGGKNSELIADEGARLAATGSCRRALSSELLSRGSFSASSCAMR